MKRFVFLGLLLASLTGCVTAEDGRADNERLRTLWDDGQYNGVIVLLEEARVQGLDNAELYLMLGDAYWQVDEVAYALLAWRRAQLRAPLLEGLEERIAWGRLRVGIQENIMPGGLVGWAVGSERSFTKGGLVSMATWLWATVWGVLWVMWRRDGWRDGLVYVLIGVSLLLGLVLSTWASRVYVYEHLTPAIVLEENVDVFNGAGDDYLRLFRLYGGQEIYRTSEDGDWIRVRTRDGREGWIMRDNVGYIPKLG